MACKGMVILNQTYYSGWEATVDGHPVRIFEACGSLQGIVTGAGAHSIELRYRPLTVYWGSFLTAVGLSLSLLWR